jgi:hypothetical protein
MSLRDLKTHVAIFAGKWLSGVNAFIRIANC